MMTKDQMKQLVCLAIDVYMPDDHNLPAFLEVKFADMGDDGPGIDWFRFCSPQDRNHADYDELIKSKKQLSLVQHVEDFSPPGHSIWSEFPKESAWPGLSPEGEMNNPQIADEPDVAYGIDWAKLKASAPPGTFTNDGKIAVRTITLPDEPQLVITDPPS